MEMYRFDGEKFLKMNRGKKVMFVGDSLSSNQWQSLACMLYDTVRSNHTFEINGPLSTLSFPVSSCFVSNNLQLVIHTESLN